MASAGRPTTTLDLDEIRRLTEAGWHIKRIAEHLGVSKHIVWAAMKRNNIPRLPQHSMPGDSNPAWKGGRYIDAEGYVSIYDPTHPHAKKSGHVLEHRLVMESILGRYLTPVEVVHHKDKNKQNNDPSNLELYERNSAHLRSELTGHIPAWTKEGMERIRIGVSKPRQPASEETRRKMSATRKGRPGIPRSPETREKIRQKALERSKNKKQGE